MSAQLQLARDLARKLLPDARAADTHVQATYDRMLEATGKALLRLELVAEARDQEELEATAAEAFERMAAARSALIDHAQAVLSLARAWSGE